MSKQIEIHEVADGVKRSRLVAPAATIAALTDSSGGTASDTLAAITGSYVEATIENTVASLAAKINGLIAACKTHGIIAES